MTDAPLPLRVPEFLCRDCHREDKRIVTLIGPPPGFRRIKLCRSCYAKDLANEGTTYDDICRR